MSLPETTARVERNTPEDINERIERDTEQRLRMYAGASISTIDARLKQLDREWDIERTLEANAAAVALAGLTLGVAANRKWLVLPFAVAGFLLQHAVQGWCPPVPLFRRLGVRTSSEIGAERTALKVFRGDFDAVGPVRGEGAPAVEEILRAVKA